MNCSRCEWLMEKNEMAAIIEEQSDRDAEWFYMVCERKGIRPSMDQEESFVFKVADLMADMGLSEYQARKDAFKLVFGVSVT